MSLAYVDTKEMVRKSKLKIHVHLVPIGENVQKINIKSKLRHFFYIKSIIMFLQNKTRDIEFKK